MTAVTGPPTKERYDNRNDCVKVPKGLQYTKISVYLSYIEIKIDIVQFWTGAKPIYKNFVQHLMEEYGI